MRIRPSSMSRWCPISLASVVIVLFAAATVHGQAAPVSDRVVISFGGAPIADVTLLEPNPEGVFVPIFAGALPGIGLLPQGVSAMFLVEPGTQVLSDILIAIVEQGATETFLNVNFWSDAEGPPVPCPPGGFPAGPCIAETGALQNVTEVLFGPNFATGPVQISVFSDVERTPEPGLLLLVGVGAAGLVAWRARRR